MDLEQTKILYKGGPFYHVLKYISVEYSIRNLASCCQTQFRAQTEKLREKDSVFSNFIL